MTAQDRERHRRNQERQSPALPSESRASASGAPKGVWLIRGGPSGPVGVVWLKRPMPDGQWPPDQSRPRDDSYSWWVRAHCGHQGGAKQWAFREEADVDTFEMTFRENPCRFTRCPERIMIENDGRLR